MKGTITAIKRAKGFGFIRGEDGIDRFFHANGVVGYPFDSLQEGTAVTFDAYQQDGAKDNGLRARRVTVDA
jgi:CspA family cold shock protein